MNCTLYSFYACIIIIIIIMWMFIIQRTIWENSVEDGLKASFPFRANDISLVKYSLTWQPAGSSSEQQ